MSVPLKDRNGITIPSKCLKNLEFRRKLNKTWVDQGSEVYKRSMKSQLCDNDIEMHSIHNDRKSPVAENFIRTLKAKIYKNMTAVSKNVYIDKLDGNQQYQ